MSNLNDSDQKLHAAELKIEYLIDLHDKDQDLMLYYINQIKIINNKVELLEKQHDTDQNNNKVELLEKQHDTDQNNNKVELLEKQHDINKNLQNYDKFIINGLKWDNLMLKCKIDYLTKQLSDVNEQLKNNIE